MVSNSSRHYGEFFIIRSINDHYPPKILCNYLKTLKKNGKWKDYSVIPLPILYDLLNIEGYVWVILGKNRRGKRSCPNCRCALEVRKGDLLVQRAGLNLGSVKLVE